MKKIILFTVALALTTPAIRAQRNKMPKMAPVYEKGYYISQRGDTVRGDIQVNPEDETEFHRQFSFRAKGQTKPRAYNAQRSKGYGYGSKHYVLHVIDGEKLFLRRLAKGRLSFFEYRFHGKKNGYDAIDAVYYIRDNGAEGEDLGLRELKEISGQFYKRQLKPYMKDQLILWDDLDKFDFDRKKVIEAIREFNRYYPSANG